MIGLIRNSAMKNLNSRFLGFLKEKGFYMPAAIFFISFIPRILLLSKGPFHYDTVDLLIQMRDRAFTSHGIYFPAVSAFVIFIAYLKGFFLSFASDFGVILFLTAFVASVSCSLIYILLKKILSDDGAIIFSVLVSFFPVYFSVTTFGRLDHAFSILAIVFFLHFLFKNRFYIACVFLALAISSRGECIFLLVSVICYIAFFVFSKRYLSKKKKIFTFIRISMFVFLITVGIWAIMGLLVGGKKWFDGFIFSEIIKRFSTKDTSVSPYFWEFKFSNIMRGFMIIYKAFPVLFFVGLYGAWLKLKSKNYKECVFFFLGFLVPFLYVVNREADIPRYVIVPAFFLLYFIAYGTKDIIRLRPAFGGTSADFAEEITWSSIKIKASKLGIACVFAFFMFVYIFPVVYPRHLYAYQVDIAKYIQKNTPLNSTIIIQDSWIFMDYYGSRNLIIPPADCDKDKWNKFISRLVKALSSGKEPYMLATAFTYDFCSIMMQIMNSAFLSEKIGEPFGEDWHGYCSVKRHIYKETIFRLYPIRPK